MKIKLLETSPATSDVVADLRALADLAESDTDGFVAAMLAVALTDIWPSFVTAFEVREGKIWRDEAAIMAEAIRRFKAVATGPVGKKYTDHGQGYFDASIPMRALTIKLTAARADVCERVVTGVTTVTEQVPDPQYLAAAPMVEVSHEVEQVEWRCAPIMAATQGEQA